MADLTDEEKRAFDKIAKRFRLRFKIINIRRVPKTKRSVGAAKIWTDARLGELWLEVERLKLIHSSRHVPWSKIKLPLLIDVFGWEDTGPIEVAVPSYDRNPRRGSTRRSHIMTLKRLYRQAQRRMKEDPKLARKWTRELEDQRWLRSKINVVRKP
jgi:hypothetical protein